MRRKIGLGCLPLTHDKRIGLFTQPIELGGPTRREAVLALKAERHAQIHQLDNRQEAARVLAHLGEQVEETLAAAYLLMKGRDQRARGPHPRAAPGSVQHRIVEACAERIMPRPNLLDRDAEVASALFKMAHRAERALAQIARVRLIERVAQAG